MWRRLRPLEDARQAGLTATVVGVWSCLGAALVGASELLRFPSGAGSARPCAAFESATPWSGPGAQRPGGKTTRQGGEERGTYCSLGRGGPEWTARSEHGNDKTNDVILKFTGTT
ncbi:hypothetical protein NDU88_003245 [Pleurodeles waltl]|uniref:Uncharacterized protein n=1 Tax=Pleurodeles waltl TaxID=8319 RepID=A0AAV7KV02_PLEWA|nr:hypothetical protein NDU88_003245 [Pleurodeles waltl]